MYTPEHFEGDGLFDYDGAIRDLREMYERGRQWIADNLQSRNIQPVYDHTLQISYAMMEFSEFAAMPEAV